MSEIDTSGLPDPADRNTPWAGDIPAYEAWHRAISSWAQNDNTAATAQLSERNLLAHYGEAVPTLEALQAILKLGPLIEVAAGIGYWARLLQDLGGDVVATDRDPGSWEKERSTWTHVDRVDAVHAASKHPDRALLLVWPPRNLGFCEPLLTQAPQRDLALVTDGPLRLFGDDLDDPIYELLDREWPMASRIELPHFPFHNDFLAIRRRRTSM